MEKEIIDGVIDSALIEEALEENDSELLNLTGADYYNEGDYKTAKIYYELASAMGNDTAMSNLGYIYMYGRGVPTDYKIAMAYFKISAEKGNIEATYKLGNLYQSGKGVDKNIDLAIEYYDKALNLIKENDINEIEYPSVYFTLAKEMLPNGSKDTNLKIAYEYIQTAINGYKHLIEFQNANYYSKVLSEAEELLQDTIFDEFRNK